MEIPQSHKHLKLHSIKSLGKPSLKSVYSGQAGSDCEFKCYNTARVVNDLILAFNAEDMTFPTVQGKNGSIGCEYTYLQSLHPSIQAILVVSIHISPCKNGGT